MIPLNPIVVQYVRVIGRVWYCTYRFMDNWDDSDKMKHLFGKFYWEIKGGK